MNTEERATVLVVDDIETNLDIMVECLGDDYEVAVAMDGQSCLEAVAEEQPDIILLDIMMPGMDGYEVCQRLKAAPESSDIPVIFVTALGEVSDETRGLELGAVDYITKPVSAAIVRARVKTHLTLARQRAQLASQNAELREAARLREDVEHITRHDLKSPLSAVIGFAQLMKLDKSLGERQLRSVAFIEESGYRILNMINRSLDLFKMERGTYVLKATRVDLMPVVHHVCSEQTSLAESTNIRIEIMCQGKPDEGEDSAFISGEELLCHSLFANLLKNAVEASPPETTITVSVDRHDGEWAVAIHNQGAVPAEIRDRFFEKFSTAGKGGGTGLGTYSAKLITETLHGSIALETDEVTGTTITVSLPASSEPAGAAKPPPKARTGTPLTDRPVVVPERLLVADDNEPNRRLLAQYLEKQPFQSDFVPDGQAAVEAAAATAYDVILLDLEMPRLGGIEAAQQIRAAAGSQEVRLIALSGHDDDSTRQRCKEAGFDLYLVKPVDRPQLLVTLGLETVPSAAEPEQPAQAPAPDGDACVVEVDADLEDLMPTFMEAQHDDLAAMREGFAKEDYSEVRACCHRIKGTAKMYGFDQLSDMALAGEKAAIAGDRDGVEKALTQIADHLDHVTVRYCQT